MMSDFRPLAPIYLPFLHGMFLENIENLFSLPQYHFPIPRRLSRDAHELNPPISIRNSWGIGVLFE